MRVQRKRAILAPLVALALLVSGLARAATYPAVTTPDGRQLVQSLVENPAAGQTFYKANAFGPSTLRENFTVDSTSVEPTNGATRIRVWLYIQALADTTTGAAIQDSANITWVGVRLKTHLTTQPDSGVAARVLQVRGYGMFNGASALMADTTGMRWSLTGAAQNTWNRDIWATPMASEVMVGISRPTQTGAQSTGQPGWVAVDMCIPDVGCITGANVQAVVRIFGHSTSWPASGPFVVIKNPTRRYSVRCDLEGLR